MAKVAEDALGAAKEIAAGLADVSPRANEITKAMIHAAVDEDRGAAIEALGAAAASPSADRHEGVDAFLNKRSPKFTGQ